MIAARLPRDDVRMKRRMRRRTDSEPVAPPPRTEPGEGIAGYRVVRRIASGRRADVFLGVAARGDARVPARGVADAAEPASLVALRVYRDDVDDESITTEIEIMENAPSASPPMLIDVATGSDGARVLVVERIAGTTVGQLLADRALEPGEAVTLIAPIADAIARLAEQGFVHERLSPSDVRLDETGRPRLLGLGGVVRLPPVGAERTVLRREGLAALVDYVEAVAGAVRPVGVFDEARDLMAGGLAARPLVPFERDLERAVFAAAAPAAISGASSSVQVSRVPARLLSPQPSVGSSMDAPMGENEVSPGRRAGIPSLATGLLEVAEVPVPILERLADSIEGDRLARFRLGVRRWTARRRSQMIVAALVGAAALVALLAAVPPASAGDGGADGRDAPARATSDAAGGADGAPAPPAGEPSSPDPATAHESTSDHAATGTAVADALSASAEPSAAASELVRRRATCFAELDLDCLGAIVQPGSPIEESDWNLMLAARDGGDGARPLDADRVEIVAEMGAAVLVRMPVDGETEPASLLMVRSEAGWRLREIFD
jgi:hypothetical protein